MECNMTKELTKVKSYFELLGRNEKLTILNNSNLNDRDTALLTSRLVQGKSLKECSDDFGIEEDSINKAQLKAVKKLYYWIIFNLSIDTI